MAINGKGQFNSPTKGVLSEASMINDIAAFVADQPKEFYSLIIGTDSQTRGLNGKTETSFVTAIIVYRVGHGARYFWKKIREGKKLVLRDKIYTETMMSIDIAKTIVPAVREKISPNKYDFEIHIDVGPAGPTRDMIREVVGMVNGNGFTAKTKPESWGASSVADKHA